MKSAVILFNLQEVEWVKNNLSDADLYTTDFLVTLHSSSENIANIYEEEWSDNLDTVDIIWIAENWFRDENNFDFTSVEDISMFQALVGSNEISLGMVTRDFNALKSLSVKYNSVYLPVSANQLFLRIASKFKNIQIYDSGEIPQINKYTAERTLSLPMLNWHYRYGVIRLLRVLQSIVYPSKFKNKIICLADWTTSELIKTIEILSTKPSLSLKCAFFVRGFFSSKLPAFPKSVSEILSLSAFQNKISERHPRIDTRLIVLFHECLENNYNRNKKILIKAYQYYWQFLKTYTPKAIILPGERMDFYVILIQLCKKYKIPTYLLVDGFPFSYHRIRSLKDELNKNYLISKVFVQGNISVKNRNTITYLGADIIPITAPITYIYQQAAKRERKYDAIIMTYFHDDSNPKARPELSVKIILDIINLLNEFGKTKIAIKVKGELDCKYIQQFIDSYFPSNKPIILKGMFYEHIGVSDIVVGGVSTAIAECVIFETSYFIYEPESNGYKEEFFTQGIIGGLIPYSLTLPELKENIRNHTGTNILSIEERENLLFSEQGFNGLCFN